MSLAYILFDQDGNVAGQADKEDPLTYVHGYAQILPGLERGVVGLAPGERREFVVDADEAFGSPDDNAIIELDRADLPENGKTLHVGDELVAEDDDDDHIVMRVVELKPDTVLVDTNHPLAGQTVRFEVLVCGVRAATEDEISAAESDLESRAEVMCCGDGDHDHAGHDHSHAGHNHDHDHASHGHEAPAVVQLRRKLSN